MKVFDRLARAVSTHWGGSGMRTFGSARRWPPEAPEELAQLLFGFRAATHREVREAHINVLEALTDLEAWLADPRTYDNRQAPSWESAIRDARTAIEDRGAAVTSATPSLATLLAELSGGLAKDDARRRLCLQLSHQARAELGTAESAALAFKDLTSATEDPNTSAQTLGARLRTLSSSLQAGGRSLSAEARLLAGVADGSMWEALEAKSLLDGSRFDPSQDLLNQESDMTWPERTDLCDRLLREPRPAQHWVVWIAYGNARLGIPWKEEIGALTFYSGSALLGVMTMKDEAREGTVDLPDEFASDPHLTDPRYREDVWPSAQPEWVAVRIDLGVGVIFDPVGVARQQADAVVGLAGFYGAGAEWQPLTGSKVFVDGDHRSTPGSFYGAPDDPPLRDYTGEVIHDLAETLGPHLPVEDPNLTFMLNAARTIHANQSETDVTSIVHNVRIIEAISGRRNQPWQRHLKECFAIRWARQIVLNPDLA